jgi:hypothetical protein
MRRWRVGGNILPDPGHIVLGKSGVILVPERFPSGQVVVHHVRRSVWSHRVISVALTLVVRICEKGRRLRVRPSAGRAYAEEIQDHAPDSAANATTASSIAHSLRTLSGLILKGCCEVRSLRRPESALYRGIWSEIGLRTSRSRHPPVRS